MVYVQNVNGTALMPCSSAIARILLKDRKARVKRTTPFVIKLLREPKTTYTQPLTLGIDAGSGIIGSAVVRKDNRVVYRSEIIIRNDITRKMRRRKTYRRTRRNRKCRYRPCRFLNRKNSIRRGRMSPTIRSKVNAHLREIKFIKFILPITEIILEGGTFDMHAIKNPKVLTNPILYQKGIQYSFHNVKAYILHRDGYKCKRCGGRSNDPKLCCHHIIFRCNGGSDAPENLIVLCETCHNNLHAGVFNYTKQAIVRLIHATQMNVILSQLRKMEIFSSETFGYITKANREDIGLVKSHSNDAIMIASRGNNVNFNNTKILYKKCVSKGDYQQRKGRHSEKHIPTGKIHGYRKFDKVKYLGKVYFIKGRMSRGYAILMDIHGIRQEIRPIPKFDKMKRINARSSWLMIEKQKHPIFS